MISALKDGIYALTGVEPYNEPEKDMYGAKEGFRICLNGDIYNLYLNHTDGYRSYAGIYKESCSNSKLHFPFPPQMVKVENVVIPDKDGNGDLEKVIIKDANNDKIVFKAYTDYYDSYYPVGSYEYYPQNLATNKYVPTERKLSLSNNDIAIIKYSLTLYQDECFENDDNDTTIAIDIILNQLNNL